MDGMSRSFDAQIYAQFERSSSKLRKHLRILSGAAEDGHLSLGETLAD
jgi:hypothetical protein